MTTLTIQDLSTTDILDRKQMRTVRGGFAYLPYPFGYGSLKLSIDNSIKASQDVAQFQSVTNSNGDGSAFLDFVKSDLRTNQNARNDIHG